MHMMRMRACVGHLPSIQRGQHGVVNMYASAVFVSFLRVRISASAAASSQPCWLSAEPALSHRRKTR